MYCKNCGKEVKEENNFCTKCGMKIDKEEIRNKYIIISHALKNNNELTFKYHNKLRRFIPYNFTFYKDFIYITGYSIEENDIKTLNLSLIKDLKANN